MSIKIEVRVLSSSEDDVIADVDCERIKLERNKLYEFNGNWIEFFDANYVNNDHEQDGA